MNRRDVLARIAAGIGGAATLSGCTEETLTEAERPPAALENASVEEIDLPVEQRLAAAAEGIERAESAAIETPDDLEAYLVDQGIEVESVEEQERAGEPIVSLEYLVDEESDRGMMHHLGVVAGGYAGLVEAGHDSEELEAKLLDSALEPYGEYYVKRQWAREYSEGAMTAREYADEVVVEASAT